MLEKKRNQIRVRSEILHQKEYLDKRFGQVLGKRKRGPQIPVSFGRCLKKGFGPNFKMSILGLILVQKEKANPLFLLKLMLRVV